MFGIQKVIAIFIIDLQVGNMGSKDCSWMLQKKYIDNIPVIIILVQVNWISELHKPY